MHISVLSPRVQPRSGCVSPKTEKPLLFGTSKSEPSGLGILATLSLLKLYRRMQAAPVSNEDVFQKLLTGGSLQKYIQTTGTCPNIPALTNYIGRSLRENLIQVNLLIVDLFALDPAARAQVKKEMGQLLADCPSAYDWKKKFSQLSEHQQLLELLHVNASSKSLETHRRWIFSDIANSTLWNHVGVSEDLLKILTFMKDRETIPALKRDLVAVCSSLHSKTQEGQMLLSDLISLPDGKEVSPEVFREMLVRILTS